MHNHDIEIIMALAEGTLDPEAAEAARAEIAACSQCSFDLEMQTSVLASLQALPDASLTEMESARLRRNVRDELGIAKPTPIAAGRQKRRRMPLAALGTAAAVLVAVVIVGPALNLIGGSDDSSDDTIIASATTTAPASAELDAAPPNAGDLQAQEGAENPENTFAATTTAAAATTAAPTPTTTTRAQVESPSLYAYFAQVPDLAAVLDVVVASEFDPEESRTGVLKLSGDSIQEEQLDDSQVCAAITISSEDNFIEGYQVARGQLDGRDVLFIVYLAEDLEESVLIVHATDTCEELGRVGL